MSTFEHRVQEKEAPRVAPEAMSAQAASAAKELFGKVPLANLAFFFRQAGTMLKAGVGIVQSFATLSRQARNPKLAKVLQEMSLAIEHGQPMSATMLRYPEVFTPVMVSVIKAGEEGGFLDQSCSMVADYLDQEIELRNVYRRATFWPKLELVASMLIIVAANAIIDSIGHEGAQHLSSPLTTLTTWYVLGPLIIAGFLFFRLAVTNPNFRPKWDLFIIKIPFLGVTLRQIAMARFGRAFGTLYKAGVPLQKALILGADACGNEYLRRRMYPAYRSLQEGRGVTETLESTQAFSPIVLDMIRTGETTGTLDQMLSRTSDFYIDEAMVRQHQLAMVVGVLCVLFVAVYIGYIVITFWTGYFSGLGGAMGGA